jgi:hypothetical protein
MAVERRRYMLAKNNLEYRLKCYQKKKKERYSRLVSENASH